MQTHFYINDTQELDTKYYEAQSGRSGWGQGERTAREGPEERTGGHRLLVASLGFERISIMTQELPRSRKEVEQWPLAVTLP